MKSLAKISEWNPFRESQNYSSLSEIYEPFGFIASQSEKRYKSRIQFLSIRFRINSDWFGLKIVLVFFRIDTSDWVWLNRFESEWFLIVLQQTEKFEKRFRNRYDLLGLNSIPIISPGMLSQKFWSVGPEMIEIFCILFTSTNKWIIIRFLSPWINRITWPNSSKSSCKINFLFYKIFFWKFGKY